MATPPPPPPPPAAPAPAPAPAPAADTDPSAPPRVQVEHTLEQLLQTLLEMGICASDVQESALETSVGGVASGQPGGLLGRKAQQTVEQLARLYSQKDLVNDINVPIEVINLVDQGKNPHLHTKNFIERLAGENMYTNGILSGITDYRDLLRAQLGEAFPDLAEDVKLMTPAPAAASDPVGTSSAAGDALHAGGPTMNGINSTHDVKMEDAR
ncbi:mediator of RNA polymerase II transcription subunit 10 [Rhodotorula sp. JG-1b]|nr:mediator of RNA polymerase II transcription subunit 10 [Rhodotorula sp. JG-1b]